MRAGICAGALGLCLAAGQVALAQEAPAQSGAPEQATVDAGTYGPTTRDDTLWSIARKVRPDGLTVAQTVSALQRMNPHAFLAGDPNQLMRGVVLKIPTAASATETPTAAQASEQDSVQEEASTPAVEEAPPADVDPVPEAMDETPEMLALRNADLEQRLQAVQTELDLATAKTEALEAQVSSMRHRLAESEQQVADAQSLAANDAGAFRWNSVTGVALAALLVAVIAFLFLRVRGGREAAATPAPQPLGARRIATGRLVPEEASGSYVASTKLNLARAFVDMGRDEQAREVLEEVLAEGNEEERREAEYLLGRME